QAETVLGELGPGGIVLLHDSALYAERDDVGATIAAIPAIVAGARDAGLGLTTLSGALDGSG
ncbi:MAG: polysaccharide deacetylase family protein, partial [Gaiellales bacterium]